MASFDSVHLDPNFAVICAFFEKFSTILNMDIPNFELLEEWLTNSDESELKFSVNVFFSFIVTIFYRFY